MSHKLIGHDERTWLIHFTLMDNGIKTDFRNTNLKQKRLKMMQQQINHATGLHHVLPGNVSESDFKRAMH